MSSTLAHNWAPSSLPSDYAILSRLNVQHESNALESERPNSLHIGHQRTRRGSFPTEPYHQLNNTSDGARPHADVHNSPQTRYLPCTPTESTPLLSNLSAENDSKMFWEEFVILAKYALPIFGTLLLEYSLVVVSVISIGHISTTALAAITLGSMTASVSGYSVIQGFTSALDTMLPSAWTSSTPQLVGLWTQRMIVIMFPALVPMLLIWLNAEPILLFLKQEPEVAHMAAVYLHWASIGLPAYTFNCISRRYFQSQGLFAVPTRILFIAAPANALLNWLLVWGPNPIRLGFIGAPIATAISFNLISIMSIWYGVFVVPKTAWHPISSRMFKELGILVQLGLSGVVQTASEWWAWELLTLVGSLLGPTVLAAQSVIFVSASLSFQAPFALGVATSVRIGNLLGEENARRAKVASHTSIVMAFIIDCILSAMLLIFRDSWAYLFNDDPAVVGLVASILPLLALFQVFDGWLVVTAGILRAMGKQFLGALLNLSVYYVFGIPLGIYLTFSKDLGLQGLWIGLTCSLVYGALLGIWVCLRTDWDHEVDKVVQRLKEEDKARGDLEDIQRVRDEERWTDGKLLIDFLCTGSWTDPSAHDTIIDLDCNTTDPHI